jgi:hypothetical protein
MYKKSIAITAVLAASILAVVAISTPMTFADESETETEQEIKQKNVCSGWAIFTIEAVNTEDTGSATTIGTSLAFPL